MREFDYVIIGSGIAGMTLHRFLGAADVVLLDHEPDRYKIGESITPPHFFAHELRPLLDVARSLPSAQPKLGTIFVTSESTSFFHAHFDAQFTIHVDRQELEATYRRCLEPPIVRERVIDVDVEQRIVETANGRFKARKQIFDCSGPAMVLSRRLDLAFELWPVWASWAYFDVSRVDDRRFWRTLASTPGGRFLRFDESQIELVPSTIDPQLAASETTMLTRFADGIWTWQIPLYRSKILSFGVVSRHGPIDEERYLEITRGALGAQYDATLRPWDRSSPHNAFHRRHRFAWASKSFAGPGWALVGDAAFFGDPVYSVGTGLATSQAIRLASLVRRHAWESGGWQMYDQKTREIFQDAKRAYEHWYAGEVTTDGAIADEIQLGFLNGQAFHHRTTEHYLGLTRSASPDDASDPCFTGDPGEDVTPILEPRFAECAGWTVERAILREDALELAWRDGSGEPLSMLIARRAPSTKTYVHAGPFALSYRGATLPPSARELFERYVHTLLSNQSAMLKLLEARRAVSLRSTPP